jgi:hypothetical protein
MRMCVCLYMCVCVCVTGIGGRGVGCGVRQTALIFPGIIFALMFLVNLFVWSQRSSSAVPFGTFVAIIALWFGISLPLVMAGAYFGQKKKVRVAPTAALTHTHTCPHCACSLTHSHTHSHAH